jgi:hypothetical protein
MSHISEMVREEAERAEAEHPDDPEPETPEGAPEPEPEVDEPEVDAPQAVAPLIDDATIAKVERANTAHRLKIEGLIGAEAVAHECFICSGLGAIAALPDNGTRFVFVLGDSGPDWYVEAPEVPPELNADERFQECATCGGYGQLVAPTKNENQRIQMCGTCNGNGYVAASVSTPPQQWLSPPQGGYGTGTNGATDAWGRSPGHEFYGRDPATIQAV